MARITLTVTAEENKSDVINNLIANASEIIRQVNSRLAHEQYINAKRIADNAIDEFYAGYTPHPKSYGRRLDLYNAYDIGIRNGEDFIFQVGPDLMKYYHHQGNEFVYENSFVRGFHGGSMGTDSNGETAVVPTYRTPIPEFSSWGDPAEPDDSPYEQIMKEWTAYLSGDFESKKAKIIMDVISSFASKGNRR